VPENASTTGLSGQDDMLINGSSGAALLRLMNVGVIGESTPGPSGSAALCLITQEWTRRKSLPTWGVVGRDFRRVHSWVIRQSAAEPDGPGVDATPVTPTFIRRSNAEPDEPLIIMLLCPDNVIFVGFSSSFTRGVFSAKASSCGYKRASIMASAIQAASEGGNSTSVPEDRGR